MTSPRITLFIIAKNEARNIAACISSAREIVSEIIVIDSLSADKTAQICQDLGAQVYTRKFDGFASQKNFALSKVTGEWALNLDADERLSPELRKEINNVVQHTKHNGFYLPFCNYFLGKKMRFSGLNKEKHLRLVRTKSAHYVGGLVHEGLKVKGSLGTLKGSVNHFSYDTITLYFSKFNRYTTLAAKQMYKSGKQFCLLQVLLTVPFEFAKRYFLKLGMLDGIRGLFWASFSSFYVFVKYAKLWYLEQKDK